MPSNPVFVFDGKLCKFEGMTKEQIINAIAQATGVTPSDVDAGFISTLVEQNKSRSIHIWKGTRAEYNALTSKDFGTLYVIDDDTTIDDFATAVQNVETEMDEVRDDIQDIQGDVQTLKGVANRYLSDFEIGGDPDGDADSGWTKYTGGTTVEAGLYLVYIVEDYEERKYMASVTVFIPSDDSNYDIESAIFRLDDNGSDSFCSLHITQYEEILSLSVYRCQNNSTVQDCDIYLHKIGTISHS